MNDEEKIERRVKQKLWLLGIGWVFATAIWTWWVITQVSGGTP